MQKILLTLISLVALASLVACGTGSPSNGVPVPAAPSGGNPVGFSNSSLNGNYVFAVNGITVNTTFAVAGVFNADGNGKITSGTRDSVNDAGGQTLGESITGSYSVNQDGRGLAILNGNSGQSIYFFVLSSSSAGKLFQDGTTSGGVAVDAIGRLALQTGTPALAGTYVVRLDGEDSSSFSYAAIGGLTVSGTTLTGSIDENDSGVFTPTFGSTGSYALSGSRGTASFTAPTGGAHHFVVYYVSPSRLELISTDTKFFLHGYADLQTSVAGLTGGQVFNISGFYGNGSVVETGRFTIAGTAISPGTGIEDYNNNGSFIPNAGFGGSYSAANTGRWIASLTSTLGDILVGWQVSPQQSLVLAYNSTSSLLETGDVRTQNLAGLTSASVSGNNYAQFFEGTDSGVGNFESTGSFVGDSSGNLAGTIDYQTDEFGLTRNSPQTGSYSVDSTGRSTTTGNVSGIDTIFYTVDANTIYMISADPTSQYQGTLMLQTP